MKFITTFFFGFALMFSCLAQEKKIAGDSLLLKLQTELKNDWDLRITNDTLTIESKNYIWIDFYNSAGAPFDDPEYDKYTDEYLQKNGQKTKMIILLDIQDKWDSAKIKKVIAENKKISSAADSLIYKYKLSHLKRTHRYDEELIWDATKEEENRFEKYKKEKEAVLEKIKEIPYYNSEKYSLFIIFASWEFSMKSHYYMLPMISPKSEQLKIDSLYETLKSLLNH